MSVGVGNVNSAILGYGIRSNGSATISGYYIASVGTNLAGPLLTLPSKFAPKQTIAVMYLCDNGDGKSGYLNTQGQLYIDGMTINNKYRFNFTYPV